MPQFKILPPTSILSPLNCYSKKRLFEELSLIVSPLTEQTPKEILYALNDREACGSTICANMVGMPNAMIEGLESSIAVLAILPEAIPYNTIDADPEGVDIAFAFFFSKKDDYEKYEEILRLLYGLFKNSDLVNSLRRSWQDPYKLVLLLKKIDNILDSQIHPVVKPASVLDTITGIFTKLTDSEDKNKSKETEPESGETTKQPDADKNAENTINAADEEDDDELPLRNKVDPSEPLSVNAQEQLAQQEQLAAEANKSDESSSVLDAITGIFTKLTDSENKNRAKETEPESGETTKQPDADKNAEKNAENNSTISADGAGDDELTLQNKVKSSEPLSVNTQESPAQPEQLAAEANKSDESSSVLDAITGIFTKLTDSENKNRAKETELESGESTKQPDAENNADKNAENNSTILTGGAGDDDELTLQNKVEPSEPLSVNAQERPTQPEQLAVEANKSDESSSVLDAITGIFTKLTDFDTRSKHKEDESLPASTVDIATNSDESTNTDNTSDNKDIETTQGELDQGQSAIVVAPDESVTKNNLSINKLQDTDLDTIAPQEPTKLDAINPLSSFEDAARIIHQQAIQEEYKESHKAPKDSNQALNQAPKSED